MEPPRGKAKALPSWYNALWEPIPQDGANAANAHKCKTCTKKVTCKANESTFNLTRHMKSFPSCKQAFDTFIENELKHQPKITEFLQPRRVSSTPLTEKERKDMEVVASRWLHRGPDPKWLRLIQ